MMICSVSTKNKFYEISLLIAITIIVLSLLTIVVVIRNNNQWEYCRKDILISIVIAGSSVANAILLYNTLKSQEIANKSVRFETTLFEMLNSLKEITRGIMIYSPQLNENLSPFNQIHQGKNFFDFAINEIRCIENALQSDVNHKYKQEEAQNALIALDYERDKSTLPNYDILNNWDKKEKDVIENYNIRFLNSNYNINTEMRKLFLSDKTISYKLFKELWYPHYEPYFRLLYYILNHIESNDGLCIEEKEKYITIVRSQMSRQELIIIEKHAEAYTPFNKILKKSQLTKLFNN